MEAGLKTIEEGKTFVKCLREERGETLDREPFLVEQFKRDILSSMLEAGILTIKTEWREDGSALRLEAEIKYIDLKEPIYR